VHVSQGEVSIRKTVSRKTVCVCEMPNGLIAALPGGPVLGNEIDNDIGMLHRLHQTLLVLQMEGLWERLVFGADCIALLPLGLFVPNLPAV
jgi:hypothetical protein